jgi:iron complex outermembrane recepter protein
MKKFLLFCSLLLSTVFLFAQTKTITGKITDAATKEPMVGATVVVKGTTTGTATDADGNFKLDVPADAKTLTVSFVGYSPRDVSIGTGAVINVALETAFIPGGEVVVTSSRVAESIKQAPVQIEKMTSREIKSAASGDFYQSIGNYKGIDVVTTSAGFKVINLRGFGDTRSLRTKQYVDGVDNEAPGLNFPVGNMVGANDLDLESVEIISGAASALYGANAMQGVVSMTSKSPYDYKGLSVQLKGGGTTVPGPYFNGQFRYANTFGKENRFAFKLTGEYMQMQDWVANDDSLNRYGKLSVDVNATDILRKKVNEPYGPGTDITQEQHDDYVKLVTGWLDFNGFASPGIMRVNTPGYMEKSLADYNARNAKASAGFFYRFKNDVELSAVYKFGYGTAVYQATARYQIKDFTFHQPKLEVKGKNFFVRAYASIEDAGNSYNLGLTGSYISRGNISDYMSDYLEKYFDVLDTLTNGFCADCAKQWMVDSAHRVAGRYAKDAWYPSGSQQFKDSFNLFVKDANSTTGSKFFDKSVLVHVEGQYNWDFVKWLDIITGASYRVYLPNSRGTIFEDTGSVRIRVHEVGAYLQATKRLFNDKFKIIGSIRVDKNSNFKAQISPRGTLVYTYNGKKSDHIFRAGVTSAFRTPTLQDLYLRLDVGRLFLVGNLNGYDNLFTRESVLEYYRTPGTVDEKQSMNILKPVKLNPLVPERVLSIDFGYRTEILKKVFIDLSAYYNIYKNFIGFQRVVRTLSGNATGTESEYQQAVGDIAVNDSLGSVEYNGEPLYRVYQMWVNSPKDVPSWGASISVSYYVGKGITPYVNYSYADLDDSNLKTSDNGLILSGFNTPRHKLNIGVNANKVWKGLGFSANFKWIPQSFAWQSPFADGTVPAYHTLDLQVSYEIEKAYSTIRLGGSNIYNYKYLTAVGAPQLGALYYIGWTFDFNNFGKKNQTPAAN